MCSCLSPLVGGTSVSSASILNLLETPEDRRNGPTVRALISGEDESEYLNTFLFGMQRTGAKTQALGEVSDFGHIGVHVLEVIGLAA